MTDNHVLLNVDTIAGGGKTYASTEYCARQAAMGNRRIIALPSKAAINQCITDLRERYPDAECAAFHGDTQTKPGHVVAAIINKTKELWEQPKQGCTMFISHAAMLHLPEAFRSGWHLIIDETLSVTDSFYHNALSTGIRRSLEIAPEGASYCRITIKAGCMGMWRSIASGEADAKEMMGIELTHWKYKSLANALVNPHVDVFGLTDQWTRASLDDPSAQIQFFSLLNPSVLDGFEGPKTIMSASFKDTMMYRLWTVRNGVKWDTHKAISKRVRSTEYTNGNLLQIYYATEQDYSKTLRNRKASPDADATVHDEFVAAVGTLFGGKEFVFMANNDTPDVDEGTRLPNTPHGLNTYQNVHNCAIFSALNLTPAHIKFLSQWISADEIRQAITYQATYQAALRISLRNPADPNPKVVVVQDKGAAEYISRLFPGSTIHRLPTAIEASQPVRKGRGRDVQPAERKQAWRVEKKLLLQMGIHLVDNQVGAENVPQTNTSISAWDENRSSAVPLGMSLFFNKKSAASFHQVQWNGVDDFIALLRDRYKDVHPTKEDNKLISPSLFDPKLAAAAGDFNEFGKPRKRSRSAVVSSVGIWLDNDGGVFTHQDFAALFPDLQMVIYNTYSSTPEKIKYRVWLPTTHGMSADLYMFITGQIRAKIEGRGFRSAAWQLRWLKSGRGGPILSDADWSALPSEKQEAIVDHIHRKLPYRDHGFDWSKTMPENLMYLPCQSAAGADASFFLDLQDGLRKPLNVEAWITHPITNNSPDPEPEPVCAPVMAPDLQANGPMSAAMAKLCGALQATEALTVRANQQHRIQRAIDAWRQTPNGCGQANNAFWVLGCALRNAGLSFDEVRVHLRNEANNRDRTDQINSIISSLRKQKS